MIHRLGIEVSGNELLVEIPDNVSSHVQFVEAREIQTTIHALIDADKREPREKPPFEKDQRVRVKPDCGLPQEGREGVVQSAKPGCGELLCTWVVGVVLDGSKGPVPFSSGYLEAVEEKPKAKFKVDERVRVKKVTPDRYSGAEGVVKCVPYGHWDYGVRLDKKSASGLYGFSEKEIEAVLPECKEYDVRVVISGRALAARGGCEYIGEDIRELEKLLEKSCRDALVSIFEGNPVTITSLKVSEVKNE